LAPSDIGLGTKQSLPLFPLHLVAQLQSLASTWHRRCPTLPGSKLASTTVPNPLTEHNEAKTKHEQLVSVYTLPQQGNPTIQCRGVTRSEVCSTEPTGYGFELKFRCGLAHRTLRSANREVPTPSCAYAKNGTRSVYRTHERWDTNPIRTIAKDLTRGCVQTNTPRPFPRTGA
jgi:hypothetical protein